MIPVLRPALPADAIPLADIMVASRRAAMPWLAEPHSPAEAREWMAGSVLPHLAVRVAEVAGAMAGFAAWGHGWLHHLYITPERQGQGAGAALLAAAMAANPEGLRLWAFQRNARARGFYERRGFVLVRLTDGAGNEEKEPDAEYHWRGLVPPSAARPAAGP
ncbi:MAG: GNAT family N-acetyltransferase [Thalassobaculales bacterium]